MSNTINHERRLLEPINRLIERVVKQADTEPKLMRRLIIEGTATRIGGMPFGDLLAILEEDVSDNLVSIAWETSSQVEAALCMITIPPPLAIASLMQSYLGSIERRRYGSYLTDFRLSTLLMKRLAIKLKPGSCIVDTAAGTGAFLVAFAIEASRYWNQSVSQIASDCLYGADSSAKSIRGAICALAATGMNTISLERTKSHLKVTDSLISGHGTWGSLSGKFDAVVGNPPWEKLKLTRHEYLQGMGIERHYGDIYKKHRNSPYEDEQYIQQKNLLDDYIKTLRLKYSIQGNGEGDLYKFFLELALKLVKSEGGHISMLLPAGLIRSSGSESLRRHVMEIAEDLELTIFYNRAHYFDIDSRFKFLAMEVRTGLKKSNPLRLYIGKSNSEFAFIENRVDIDRSALNTISSGLTIPEVHSEDDWKLFQHVFSAGCRFGVAESSWSPQIVREIDMTRDRHHFVRRNGTSTLPIIEGRMIHQYLHSAKAYKGGTGRKAVWEPRIAENGCDFQPQFYYPEDYLSNRIHDRVWQERLGFCDITGQNNERTLLVAPIPPRTICGNKVPTITFERNEEWLPWAWLAYANSFLVDWVLRRMVTTTINYFIIRELPLPIPEHKSEQMNKIARLSRRLVCPIHFPQDTTVSLSPSEIAETRAEIEWRVLDTYGLDASVLGTVFADFPLLDRGEPMLEEESRSTITADLVSLRAIQNLGGTPKIRGQSVALSEIEERVIRAQNLGAVAFRPSHFVTSKHKDPKEYKKR